MHKVKDLFLRCHDVVSFIPDPAQVIEAELALGNQLDGVLQLLGIDSKALEAPGGCL